MAVRTKTQLGTDIDGLTNSGANTAADVRGVLDNIADSMALRALEADLVPNADGTLDLGSSANRFANVHVDSIDLNGTTFSGTTLADPGADRGLFWDDSASTTAYWTAGTGLTFSTTNLNAEVSLTNTATLTNKTLTAPVLGGTVTGTYTLGGTPTFPAAVVQLTTTQTLTNKTLTAPDITDPTIAHEYNAQTGTTYTAVAADQSAVITMNNASANTLTIPANATTAFPIGTKMEVWALGAGTTTIAGATGVTLQGNGGSVSAGSCDIQTRYGGASLTKIATNTWMVGGDIDAVA